VTPDPTFLYLSPTQWIACTTVVLAVIATIQACIYAAMHRTNKDIERAYVTMSHRPPGLNIVKADPAQVLFGADTRGCGIVIEIKNYGRTPARITDALIKFLPVPEGETLPNEPDYSDPLPREQTGFFLVAGDFFMFQGGYLIQNWNRVRSLKDVTLYVFGYVDYLDKFDRRHRAGYGRVFDPALDNPTMYEGNVLPADRSNLGFISNANYNYDRERKNGEGKDWKQPGRSRATSEG
jgi:hypothetical protein